ncbi:hypothetical protein SCOCK_300055 [Actinacidiphila cocklensis]|uniref:Uncharacterized protein n=1 Tax=Actinacidiphila cocklensis TaxID=887465 RepID=A0A9W4E8D0_9ACTN|nr:hypothetical protein SCOCK_300055 [Actinacidiphila cocklensis]
MPLMQPGPVREDLHDPLVVHRQHRPGKPFTPHRHLRPRLDPIPGRRRRIRVHRDRGDLRPGGAGAGGQDSVDPPAGTVHSCHSSSAAASSAWIRSASSRNPSTRRRAASSCCSSSPTTDGIQASQASDNPTDHNSHRVTVPMPDQAKRRPQARNDNRD